MNTEFTALTRPRISSGVCNCTSDVRITTLTMSDAPSSASVAIESGNDEESANTIVAPPKTATAANIVRPTCLCSGWRARMSDIAKAPIAGDARSMPRPVGPTCRMSFA